jgi:hypothetical protein
MPMTAANFELLLVGASGVAFQDMARGDAGELIKAALGVPLAERCCAAADNLSRSARSRRS